MKTLFLVIINMLITSALLDAQTIGTPDWAKRGGAWWASANGDMVREILIDKHGNVYVSAQNSGKVNIDGHIAAPDSNANNSISSWDCNGNFRWMKIGANTASIGLLGLDTLENIYMFTNYLNQSATDTGIIYPDTSFTGIGNARYIVKYNSNGNLQWMKPSTISSNLGNSVLANGTFYLFSYLLPGVYENGAFTLTDTSYCAIKYDASGNFLSKTILDMSSGKSNNVEFIYSPQSQRFYLSGTYDSLRFSGMLRIGSTTITTTKPNMLYPQPVSFFAVFDTLGQNLWVKQTSPDKISSIYDAAIDQSGNLYLMGSGEAGTVINQDTIDNNANPTATELTYIVALDSAGNNLWFKSALMGGLISANSLTPHNGFVSIAYHDFQSNVQIWQLDITSGALIAQDSIINTSPFIIIKADKNNNLYIGGSFKNQVVFGGDILNKIDVTPSSTDWFIAKYENTLCGCDLPQPNFNIANPTGNTYNFYYNGSQPFTSISWDFGDGSPPVSFLNASHSYTTNGSYPVCVTVTNGCGTNKICKWVHITTATGMDKISDEDGIFLYPNPAKDKLHIRSTQTRTVLEIYNLKGQKILQTTLQKQQEVIDINSFAPGVYLLRFTDDKGRAVSRKLIKE